MFRDLELTWLAELLKKAEIELREFEDEEKNKNSMNFQNYRYDEEPPFVATQIEEGLRNRVNFIKGTVDDHLVALHGQSNLYRFQDLPYSKKIAYLYQLAGPLSDMKDERTRMEGMT